MKLTHPQRRALQVLAHGRARVSNETVIVVVDDAGKPSNRHRRLVYWKTAAALVEAGLARSCRIGELEITPAGSRELEQMELFT